MKRILIFIFTATFCFYEANAQIPDEPLTAQSPNVASLGLYGEVPVSLYAGLPNIKVPIYTTKAGKIELPIYLSYHASGFRPDLHPGWVGMGWNLNAGGIVSRSVRGFSDEYDRGVYYAKNHQTGYYFHRNLLNRTDWSSLNNLQDIARIDYSVEPDYIDTEPDEFTFNFEGYSGKFYLNADGKWKVKCDKPVTVTSIYSNQGSPFQEAPFPVPGESGRPQFGEPKMFIGFIITTEEGTQYTFGGPQTATEYEMGMFSQNSSSWIASAWHLTQIVHNDGHMINFNYERENEEFVAQMYINLYKLLSKSLISSTNNSCTVTAGTDCKLYESYSGQIISPVYLTSIETPTSIIHFDRSLSNELRYSQSIFDYKYSQIRSSSQNERIFPFLRTPRFNEYPLCLDKLQWRKLTNIRIESKTTSQVIKSFSFIYNNDITTNTNSNNERLTLLEITESGPGIIGKPYRFGYNKYHNLPGYLTDQVDHWGFYNANYINHNTDIDFNNPTAYYNHREANQDSAVYLAGILTKIMYPTGGITDLSYEQNSFSKQLEEYRFNYPQATSGNTKAGGVRIRKITSYSLDQPQQKIEKEYFYTGDYSPDVSTGSLTSSGVLGARIRYIFPDYRGQAFNSNAIYSRSYISSQSVLPTSTNSLGTHIGYSTVVEKLSDGSYTEYKYTNYDIGYLDELPVNVLQSNIQNSRTLYSPYSSTSEERGHLVQEVQFTNTGKRVKQRTIDYAALNKVNEYIPSIKAISFRPCAPTLNDRIDEGSAFKIYTYSFLPIREIETVFDDNNIIGISNTRNYSYNNMKLIRSVTHTDSKGITLETQYKYSSDFSQQTASTYSSYANGISRMAGTKNMIGYPIEVLQLRDNKIINASVSLYSELYPEQIFLRKILTLKPTQPIDANQYNSAHFNTNISGYQDFITDSRMSLDTELSNYDAYGNVGTISKRGLPNISYIWNYRENSGDHFIAEVRNALTSEISVSNFEEEAGWDYSLIYSSQKSHTGDKCGLVASLTQGNPNHSFGFSMKIPSSLKSYTVSGWVWSDGPTAQISLFKNTITDRDSEGDIIYSNDLSPATISTTETGHWVYLEKQVLVPQTTAYLTVRLTNLSNSAGGNIYFDDVRVHPSDAQMTSYTENPQTGITSVSDANSLPTYYEYDGLLRLTTIRDIERNIIKHITYHYKNQ